MAKESYSEPLPSRGFTRRVFIKLGAVAGLLAGCSGPAQQAASTPVDPPTATPKPTSTPRPTPTTTPTVVPPVVPSKVVHTHAAVWNDGVLVSGAIRQMLDVSITELTGVNDAAKAWASLFAPHEQIAIKVNAFRNSLIWTHVPLVMAVTECLQEAGVPAEQIVIFDYYTNELEEAGYPVNENGPGVRCYGTDLAYTGDWEVTGLNIRLSDILLDCDALINIPILKSHMIAGISFALKNHYGSFENPGILHGNMGRAMAELNALPPIKDRTRLIIGDMLTACLSYRNSYPYWESDWTGDSILVSFDPVAHDTVGLEILSKLKTDNGRDPASNISMATPCLESGAELGLGTNDPDHMEVVEVMLG